MGGLFSKKHTEPVVAAPVEHTTHTAPDMTLGMG